jgi:hypothetical protein
MGVGKGDLHHHNIREYVHTIHKHPYGSDGAMARHIETGGTTALC